MTGQTQRQEEGFLPQTNTRTTGRSDRARRKTHQGKSRRDPRGRRKTRGKRAELAVVSPSTKMRWQGTGTARALSRGQPGCWAWGQSGHRSWGRARAPSRGEGGGSPVGAPVVSQWNGHTRAVSLRRQCPLGPKQTGAERSLRFRPWCCRQLPGNVAAGLWLQPRALSGRVTSGTGQVAALSNSE